jgi:DNA polymerase III subunit epsilon
VTAWWQQDFYSLDFESTGVNTRADRIVTGTLLRVDPVARTREAMEWLADPGVEIPAGATKVHGITTERARDEGRPAIEVIAEIFEALKEVFASGKALVIFNAPYDLTLFGCELLRHFEDDSFVPSECVIDPMVISKRLNKFAKGGHSLGAVCGRYDIVLSEQDAHTSAGDALAAGRLAYKQAATSRLIGAVDLDELHRRQKGWSEQQQLDYAGYRSRLGDKEVAERIRAEAPFWPMGELRLEEMAPPEPPPVTESGGEVPF